MKKLLLFIASFALPFALAGGVALAQDPVCEVGGAGGSPFCSDENQATDTSIVGKGSIINTIVDLLTTVSIVIAVIMVIVGGFLYTVSNGDASRASKGRSAIIYAVVGIVIVMLARVILLYVLDQL